MKRIVKSALLLTIVAAMSIATIGTALADAPGKARAEVKGVIAVIAPATTSTPPTLTIQPKEGPAVILKVVASTLITKAGLGKTTLDELAVDDRAEAKYNKDNFEAYKISVSHPEAKHHGYEGTIKSIAAPALTSTSFVLTPKKGGDVTINVNAQTRYKVPGMKDASLSNFKVGDKVAVLAVELNSGLMALNVNLIPGKPVHVERVGTIESYLAATTSTPGSITIKDKKEATSTFAVTTDTKIKFKQGATAVTPGYRATVVARRDPSTDQYTAREILVFGPKGSKDDGSKGHEGNNDGPKANKDDGSKGHEGKDVGPMANKDNGPKGHEGKNNGPMGNKSD